MLVSSEENATSALDRLLCTNSRRREGNNNSRLNMETKSLVSDEVVVSRSSSGVKLEPLVILTSTIET